MKKKRFKFFKMFELKDDGKLKENTENEENIFLKDKILSFFINFKSQNGQYKIVWIIRIFFWFCILALAVYGTIYNIIQFFK